MCRSCPAPLFRQPREAKHMRPFPWSLLKNWLRVQTPSARKPRAADRHRFRSCLRLEHLEDRLAPIVGLSASLTPTGFEGIPFTVDPRTMLGDQSLTGV